MSKRASSILFILALMVVLLFYTLIVIYLPIKYSVYITPLISIIGSVFVSNLWIDLKLHQKKESFNLKYQCYQKFFETIPGFLIGSDPLDAENDKRESIKAYYKLHADSPIDVIKEYKEYLRSVCAKPDDIDNSPQKKQLDVLINSIRKDLGVEPITDDNNKLQAFK